jgi:hypothetical protein
LYGTDKPDLRIGSRIVDVTSIVAGDQASKLVQKLFGGDRGNDSKEPILRSRRYITSTAGLPDFSWRNIPKQGKIYLNDHRIVQMATKYTKWL